MRPRARLVFPLALSLVVTPILTPAAATETSSLVGSVVDLSGAPIPNARVTAQDHDGRTVEIAADAGGRFDLATPAGRLRVTAVGFEPAETIVPPDETKLTIVLRPAVFAETLVVTANRGEERLEGAAATTVLTSAELAGMAAGSIDDALRSTPDFSLFRRSSSRAANPTSQGVTLRGISGSGASRTLVLADGWPLNDPFGGWVTWNRIPQAAIDRVEVVRGATGDLYGAGALGGVVQILTLQPDATRVRAVLDGGSHDSARGSLFGSVERNGWGASGGFEGVRTDGVFVVAPEDRGPIDTRADSDYQTGFVAFGRGADRWHAWINGGLYSEDRGNGTPMQVNSTDWSRIAAAVGGIIGGGTLEMNAGGGTQDYYQTFTAVAQARDSERLTSEQTIGTSQRVVDARWAKPFGRVTLVTGADFHRTESTLNELRYSATGVRTGPFLSGGAERLSAAYVRAAIDPSRTWSFEIGGRGDWWRSEPIDPALPVGSARFFSPRAAIGWRRGDLTLQGAAYRASRTPTLNELHRGFRAGNVVTEPNPRLAPETLTGVEAGALVSLETTSIRATAFLNDLDGAIANVTISRTPTLITRRRENSDSIRAAGLEVELDARPTPRLSAGGQIVLISSRFRGSAAAPSIEGNTVPQVPRVQGGLTLTWADPRWLTLSTQVRFSGEQFDDDLNTPELVLHPYAVWDAQVSRTVARGSTAYLAIENMTDAEYDVSRTPVRAIGWPRTIRAGLRVAWR